MIVCRTFGFLPIVGVAFVAGCSNQSEVTRKLGDRTFAIPRQNIVKSNIFYLPASQNRGLRFVINPDAPRNGQILVSMDPENNCPRKYDLPTTDVRCKALAMPTGIIEQNKLARTSQDGDVWWEYRLRNSSMTVASCTALVDRSDALCMSHGLYQNLPYTVHFRDSEIANLVQIRRKVERILSDWEVR